MHTPASILIYIQPETLFYYPSPVHIPKAFEALSHSVTCGTRSHGSSNPHQNLTAVRYANWTKPSPLTALRIDNTEQLCLATSAAAFPMPSANQEMSYTLVFGIAGLLVALTAVLVAFLQLRRTRRVRYVYELA